MANSLDHRQTAWDQREFPLLAKCPSKAFRKCPCEADKQAAGPRLAETCRSWLTMAVFTSPSQLASNVSASAGERFVTARTMRRARSASLVFDARMIDHQVAISLAKLNHRARGEHVENHLGRGAGLHAGRTANHFGSNDDGNADITISRELRIAIAA